MTRARILVVDDEHNIRSLLRLYLSQDGYEVIDAVDGQAALAYLQSAHPPDLMILDLMLPGTDGWEICRMIRGGRIAGHVPADLPILMLTARDDDVDKIVGLELGADDYVTKPFNPREVVARVKAILRRGPFITARESPGAPQRSTTGIVVAGNMRLDIERREVTIGDHPVTLRRKEFDLLHALLRQPEIVLSRDQLLNQVWGYDYYGRTRTVDAHVAALRRKLAGSDVEIETVTGIGYRLTVVDHGLTNQGGDA